MARTISPSLHRMCVIAYTRDEFVLAGLLACLFQVVATFHQSVSQSTDGRDVQCSAVM